MRTLRAALLAAACTLLASSAARAETVVDENQGYWLDGYGDSSGLYSGTLGLATNTRHDPAGGLVTLDDPAQDGVFVSELIAPASFSAWTTVRVNYTASAAGAVTVAFRDEDGGTEYPVALSPVGGAWTASGALGVPASVERGRLVVRLAHGAIPPTVSAVEVRWTPKSVVGVGITAVQSSVCAADTITYRVGTAVSFVDADRLVVYAPMPEAIDNADPLAEPAYVSATSGGRLNGGTPLTLGAVTVPANAVYWDLGGKSAGETFILSFVVRTRMGTTDGTTYEATAFAGANNAEPVAAGAVTTVLESRPSPFLNKSVGGAYRINGSDYADPGTALTFNVSGGNYAQTPSRCGETYRNAVVFDDVSEVLAAIGAAAILDEDISDGGHFTATPIPNVAGSGVDVPANSVYWLVGDVPVSGRFNRSYQVTVTSGTSVTTDAWLRSGEHTEQAHAGHLLKIGIPWNPTGSFALGDRVRGTTQINASPTDNRYKTVGYGDTITFLPYVRNGGASSLEDVVMIAAVPPGTSFESAYAPSGVTVRYCDAADCPPPVDLESLPGWNGATGVLDPAVWSDTPTPDTAVVWYRVAHLASPFFPESGVPTAATTELTVTVDQPTAECPEITVRCDATFEIFGYTPQNGSRVDNDTSGPALTLYEPVEVIPTVPDLSGTAIIDIPGSPASGETVRYRITLPNASSGGGPTDTALDVVATLTLPSVSVNGVVTRLPFADIATDGGTVALDGLPDRVVVRYPKIFPNQTRTIDLTLAVPRGILNETNTSLAVRVESSDDVCGDFVATENETTKILGEPYLAVTKQVDFSVAGPGTELAYALTVRNAGNSPATGSWVVDRVPTGTSFVDAGAFGAGSVWFSAAPSLPEALSALSPLSGAQIANAFVKGALVDGRWTSPFGAATTWVAFSVDDPALSPPQLVTDSSVSGDFRVAIAGDAINGAVVTNEAAVLSDELLQSIGNRVRTTIATRPSLVLDKTCPAVAAAGERFSFEIAYVNDSTNDDTSVLIADALPDGVTLVGYTHTFNAAVPGGAGVPALVADGQALSWDVTAAIGGPLGPRGGGVFTVEVVADGTVPSGTTVINQATGETANEAGTFVVFDSCPTLIENADLYARAAVDNARPRSGEVATFTLFVSNEGAHLADAVTVSNALPAGLTYVPGSARVVTGGYQLAPAMDPAIVAGSLIWSPATGNGITASGGTSGVVPGHSGDVLLTFQARVDAGVAPGTSLESCVHLSTTTTEDPVYSNDACVTVTTPLPDPAIQISGASLIRPRTTVSYTVTYGNQANEDATGVYFVVTLPDGPTPSNGAVDLTYLGATAPRGEALWFASATAGDPGVTFDPASPASDGWTQTPSALASVTHVAVVVGDLPAYDGPYSVGLQLLAVDPTTDLGPQAGARIRTCTTIASATPDDDPSNNDACHDARTPGVDVAASAICDPSGALPGAAPGAIVTVEATLENSGTVDAFGLKLTPLLPGGAVLVGDGTGAAVVTGSGGGESAPVDVSGVPLSGAIAWTVMGDAVVLGDADAGSPRWYRRVGLSPGDRATLLLTVRLPDDLPDNTVFTTGATAATDLRFDADETLTEELLENNPGTCATLVYRADVFVSKAVTDLTTGSDDLARAGDRLGYTVEYGNAGHFAASDVILEDRIPDGADFVVGSIANLFTDAVVVEYDDGSQAWTYAPAVATGLPDPGVRAFRVRWTDPLDAPANNVFAQSTAVAFAGNDLDGVEPDAGRDALHPMAPGADGADDRCEDVVCGTGHTSCGYGWYIPEGECCAVCRDAPSCEETSTNCSEGYRDCDYSQCDFCEGAVSPADWNGRTNGCTGAVGQAFGAWVDCLDAGGTVDDCASLEVEDAWATCAGGAEGLPTSCPDLPAASCDWTSYGGAMLNAYQSFIGMHAACLDEVPAGEEARCDGLKPNAAFVDCLQMASLGLCPAGADVSPCQWGSYTSAVSGLWGQLSSVWTSCRDQLGDSSVCAQLETPHFGEACMATTPCTRGGHDFCAWDGLMQTCSAVFNHLRSWYFNGCVDTYGFEACDWAAPRDTCRRCQEETTPTGTDEPCYYNYWTSKLSSDDYSRVDTYVKCHQRAAAQGEDPAVVCADQTFPMLMLPGIAQSCPGPDASLSAWRGYFQQLGDVHATVVFYERCVDDLGVEACAPFEPAWGAPLRDCIAQAPNDDDCALNAWQQDCSNQASSLTYAFSSCVRIVGKTEWQRCSGIAESYLCAEPLRESCRTAKAEGRLDLDTLQYNCINRHQYNADSSYTGCFNNLAEPWDDNDTFSPDLAKEACAAFEDFAVCTDCRVDCYSDDPPTARAQVDACVYLESPAYHSAWAGSCVDSMSSAFDGQGVSPPAEYTAACDPLKPPGTPCGVNTSRCASRAAVARIPEDPAETVLAWDRFLATTDTGEHNGITFTLTDADTGAPLPGLSDVDLGALGVSDLSALDPTEVRAIALEATFHGGPDSCVSFPLPPELVHGTYSQGNRALQLTAQDYRPAEPAPTLVTPGQPDVDLSTVVDGAREAQLLGEGGHIVLNVETPSGVRDIYVLTPDTPNGTSLSAARLGAASEINVYDISSTGWAYGHVRVDGTNVPTTFYPISPTSYGALTRQQSGNQGEHGILTYNQADGHAAALVPVGSPPTYVTVALPTSAPKSSAHVALTSRVIAGTAIEAGNVSRPLFWRPTGEQTYEEVILPQLAGRTMEGSVSGRVGYGDWYVILAEVDDATKDIYFVHTNAGPGDTWEIHVTEGVPMDWRINGYLSPDGTLMMKWYGEGRQKSAVFFPNGGWEIAPYVIRDTVGLVAPGGSLIAVSPSSGRPLLWEPRCATAGQPWLDAWSLLYTTDKNPSFDYQLQVADLCQTEVTNTVDISSTTPEITDANNHASASIAVETANVRVAIGADKSAVLESDTLTWTITWWNDGPGVARDAVVSALFGDLFVPDDNASAPGPWALGDVEPGASGTITVSGTLDDGLFVPNLTLNASADIESATIDCAPGDDAASAAVATGGFPNLTVTVSGPATLGPGQSGTYTVVYGNSGNLTVDEALVEAILPAGLTITAVGQGGGETGNGAEWTVGPIEPGATGEVTITVVAPGCEAVGEELRVDASVAPTSVEVAESSTTDNAASTTTRLAGYGGRVEVLGAVDRATAEGGDELIYTAHFGAAGTGAVHGAELVATLPPGVALVDGSVSAGGVASDGVIRWSLGDLLSGDRGAVTWRASVTAAAGEEVGATALTATAADACESAGATPTTAVTDAGLHLVATADSPAVCGPRGDIIGWSILVTNTSDTPIDGVVVTDALPAGTSYVPGSISGPGASAQTAPVLVWTVGTVPARTAYTLGFRTTAPSGGGVVVRNSARVEATGVAASTSAAAAVVSDCNGRLDVVKSWDATCGLASGEHGVRLTWRNRGATLVSGAVVTDVLPAGTDFASVDGGSYDLATRAVTFAVPPLAPGQSGSGVFRVTLSSEAGAPLVNAASVVAPGMRAQVSNLVAGALLACDDGNACTIDSCEPALGCVFPVELAGTVCDDGDLCTQLDRCMDGACVGSDAVVCEASDVCHLVGVCDPATGACSDPAGNDEAPCDDGDACTTTSACSAGACVGTEALTCDDGNDCTVDGCDVETGCTFAAADSGASCDDGDACTQVDACDGEGACVGADPVVCSASDQCHYPGVCDPESGACSDPAVPDGMLCDDGDLCTTEDSCVEGVCGGDAVVCAEPDVCHYAGVCNDDTGVCDYDEKPGDVPVPIGLTDLGTFGGEASAALAINAGGAVVGWAETAGGDPHAFWWTAEDGLVDLAPEAARARAFAVNDAGRAVFVVDDDGVEMWLRGEDGATSALGEVADFDATAFLNAAGDVAFFGASGGRFVAADGTASDVTAPSGTVSSVDGLGASGDVFGSFDPEGGAVAHGFVWRADTARDLGEVAVVAVDASGGALVQDDDAVRYVAQDGTETDITDGTAVAMSDAGVAIGVGAATGRAFVWSAAAGLVDFGTLGGAASEPVAVNAGGAVVGVSDTLVGPRHAFLWDAGTMTDLGALGGASAPVALSDSGFVAGTSVNASGALRVFLWSAERGLEDLGAPGASPVVNGLSEGGRVIGAGAHGFVSDAPRTACVVCTEDTVAPTIVCPVFKASVECVEGGAEVSLGQPSVSDACGGPIAVDNDAPAVFEPGTTAVTFTATDLAGNQASCTTTVTVEDTTGPTLACPEDLTVEADTNVCGGEVDLTVSATDGCDGADDVTVFTSAPEVFPVGETTVHVQAVDRAGNSASCDVVVTVVDTSAPTLSCPESLTVDAPPESCVWEEPLTATLSQDCAPEVSVTVEDKAYPIGTSSVTFTANAAGEELTCATALTVRDVTTPTVLCNAPEEVAFEQLPIVATARAADACGVEVEIAEPDCADCVVTDQTVTVYSAGAEGGVATWVVTATDPSGNETVQTCTVTVAAPVGPDGPDIDDIYAEGGGGCTGSGGTGGLAFALAALALLALRRRRRAAR